jgi:catechol 2,3-dioxygenase-like lactoylglutathione lyase family enzyme
MRLEVIVIPVADVDRAKGFYQALGWRQDADFTRRATGPAPDYQSYGSFASFSDPDGNGWLLQEITTRLPGR